MRNTKLITGIVKYLEPADLKEIHKFLRSPFHNSTKQLVSFFKEICVFYPSFTQAKFTKAYIYRRLYPAKTFKKGALKNLTTELTKKIKSYLAIDELKKNMAVRDELMARAFSRRNNYSQFLQIIDARLQGNKKGKEEYIKTLTEDELYHFWRYYDLLYGDKQTAQNSLLADQYLSSAMEYLDQFYFFTKLKYSAETLNRQSVRGYAAEIKLDEIALRLGRKSGLYKNVLFERYALIYELLKYKKESAFEKLQKNYLSKTYNLNATDQFMIGVMLNNFANRKINSGDTNFRDQLFALYEFQEKEGMLVQDSRMSDNTFTNVIVAAAACNKLIWAASFKKKYKVVLSEKNRTDAVNLSEAYIYYYSGKYNKTIERLNDIKSHDLVYELRFRSLSLRAFYELSQDDSSYEELAISSANNLKNFVHNKNLTDDRKEAYQNFCTICSDLINQKTKVKIQQKMTKSNNLMFRNWLEEKVKIF